MIGPNWLAMMCYDQGRIWIEQKSEGRILLYDLRSLHVLVCCLFFAMVSFVAGVIGSGVLWGLTFAAVTISWLYGMNMILAWTRISRAIRAAVRTP